MLRIKKNKASDSYLVLYSNHTYFKSKDRNIAEEFKVRFASLLERCGDEFIGELTQIVTQELVDEGII